MKYLIVLVILIVGCTKGTNFEREFTQHFIPTTIDHEELACGVDEDDVDLYRLSEIFFENDQMLTFNLNIIYYSNGLGDIGDSVFIKRIEDANVFFKELNAGISFDIIGINHILDKPSNDSLALSRIEALELISNKRANTLRDHYSLKHFHFWNKVYGLEKTINMHVFFDRQAVVAGQAGGLGATFFSITAGYLSTEYRTLEHEILHSVGAIRHPHARDNSASMTSNSSGDRIAGTYKSPNLLGLIDKDCNLVENWEDKSIYNENYKSYNDPNILKNIEEECLRVLTTNVMSYTKGTCRQSLTIGQIALARKTIETSKDLRNAIQGLEVDYADELWNEFEEL